MSIFHQKAKFKYFDESLCMKLQPTVISKSSVLIIIISKVCVFKSRRCTSVHVHEAKFCKVPSLQRGQCTLKCLYFNSWKWNQLDKTTGQIYLQIHRKILKIYCHTAKLFITEMYVCFICKFLRHQDLSCIGVAFVQSRLLWILKTIYIYIYIYTMFL